MTPAAIGRPGTKGPFLVALNWAVSTAFELSFLQKVFPHWPHVSLYRIVAIMHKIRYKLVYSII